MNENETAIQKPDLTKFSPTQLQYMQARLSATTDREAALAVGIAPTTVYSWPEKQLIDNVLAEMHRDVVQKAAIKLTNAVDRAVDVLLDEMDNHVEEGDYLLTHEYIPMLHFLTKTKPYLYNAWPMEIYGPDQLEEALQKAIKERQYLPIVVKGKETKTTPGTDSEKRIFAMRTIIDGFLKHNRYSLVWKNSLFKILAPSSM